MRPSVRFQHAVDVIIPARQDGGASDDGQQWPAFIQRRAGDGEGDNHGGGSEGPPLPPLRRSLRLRELGPDASHPWRRNEPQEPSQSRLILRALRASRPVPRRARMAISRPGVTKEKVTKEKVTTDEQLWSKMYAASDGRFNPGICSLCVREMHNITAHHVHPRFNGRRRGPSGFTEEQLEKHVPLCLSCHRLIHRVIPNETMGMSYYSPQLLHSHPRVVAWINWVTRQPIPTAATTARAERRMTRRKIKMAKRREKTEMTLVREPYGESRISILRAALGEIWAEYDKTFPSWSRGSGTPEDWRPEVVKWLNGRVGGLFEGPGVSLQDVKEAMKPLPEYRPWYLWLFDDFQARNVTMDPRRARAAGAPEPEAGVYGIVTGSAGVNTGGAGDDDVTNSAMRAATDAIEVIDLTQDDDLDEDSGWVDMDADEEATEKKLVIDFASTGHD